MRLMTNITASPKPRVMASTPRLNHAKTPRLGGSECLSMTPHIAGVSVSATNPDTATEMTMVIANCLYSCPVVPGRKAAGMNTEAMTSTTATREPPISPIALIVASLGERWNFAMLRSTFSTTTIASSTTMPIASTRPKSVSRLIEKPRASIPANVLTRATTIATTQMTVVRKLWRKTKTTTTTRMIASISVVFTSSIESRTKSLVSRDTA